MVPLYQSIAQSYFYCIVHSIYPYFSIVHSLCRGSSPFLSLYRASHVQSYVRSIIFYGRLSSKVLVGIFIIKAVLNSIVCIYCIAFFGLKLSLYSVYHGSHFSLSLYGSIVFLQYRGNSLLLSLYDAPMNFYCSLNHLYLWFKTNYLCMSFLCKCRTV